MSRLKFIPVFVFSLLMLPLTNYEIGVYSCVNTCYIEIKDSWASFLSIFLEFGTKWERI